MKKFRWTVALLVVLAMVLCTPLTAFAATWEAETSADVEKAFVEDTDDEVIINMKNDIEMETDLNANEDQKYTINGNGNTISNLYLYGMGEVEVNADITGTNGNAALDTSEKVTVTVNGDLTSEDADGLYAKDDSKVTVNGDITGRKSGDGVDANDNAVVTVNGDVTGGAGADGVDAEDEAVVTVNGNATGGSGKLTDAELQDPFGYDDGGDGIDASDEAVVTVTGNAIGGGAMGTYGYAGEGVNAYGEAKVTVGGNAIGGDVIADPEVESLEDSVSKAGNGVSVVYGATVTVEGDAIGGSTNGHGGLGGNGIALETKVEQYRGFDANGNEIIQYWFSEYDQAGSVTVKGTAIGGEGGEEGEDGKALYYYGDIAIAEKVEEVLALLRGEDNTTTPTEEQFALAQAIIDYAMRQFDYMTTQEKDAFLEAWLAEKGMTVTEFDADMEAQQAFFLHIIESQMDAYDLEQLCADVTVWALSDENGGMFGADEGEAEDYAEKTVNYIVKVVQPKGGTITVDKESGKVGEKITVSVKVDEGYTLKGVSTSVGELKAAEGGTYTFEVPVGGEIVVSAVIEAATSTPNTGDGFEMGLMGALVCVSLLGMTAMLTLRKKFN